MKKICNNCEHFTVCMRINRKCFNSTRAAECPEWKEALYTHQMELDKLKAQKRHENSKIVEMDCNTNESGEKYEVTYEIHAAAMKSLREHKLKIADGKVCWTNPETGALEPANTDYLINRYGVVIYPKTRILSDKAASEEAKRIEEKIKKYYEQRDYNMAKKRDERFFFVHVKGGTVEKGNPLVNVPPATLARLSILACHLAYDSNLLMDACRGGSRAMTLKDIKKWLNLPRATFNRFWEDVHAEEPAEGKYIIGNDDTGYRLTVYSEKIHKEKKNKNGEVVATDKFVDLFKFGKLERGRSASVQKMYIDILQTLYYGGMVMKPDGSYRDIAPTDHRTIGRILLLLPYLHEEENAICWNPYEKRTDHIMPLSSVDIAKVLGVDVDHVSREIKKMLDVTISVEMDEIVEAEDVNGEKKNVVKKIKKDMHLFSRHETGSKMVYFVNPALVYFGSTERYKALIKSEWLYVKSKKKNEEK